MKRLSIVVVSVLMLFCGGLLAMPEPERNALPESPAVAFHLFGRGNGLFGIRGRVRGRIEARQAARAARSCR